MFFSSRTAQALGLLILAATPAATAAGTQQNYVLISATADDAEFVDTASLTRQAGSGT